MLTHKGTITIETTNLILRQFRYNDDDDMLRYWVADENIQHLYCEPTYTTKEEVKGLLDNYIGSYEKEDSYRWAIIEKESNICIGMVAFFLVDTKNHFSEMEYCIGSNFQGRGYATEASKAIMDFGFNEVHFHKIQISHKEDNPISKRIIEKCGFTYDGNLRDYFYHDGHYINRLYYSMTKEEYEALYPQANCFRYFPHA